MTDTVQILKRPVLLRTVEGEQLLALASAVEIGEVLTYVAVKTAINVDMQSPAGRQLWHKAQGVLAVEKQMQFACVPRVGYKRLDDDGMPVTQIVESPIFRVRVIIDGVLVVSRDFKQEHAAVRAYDRATALYGIGERRPKSSGIARIERDFKPLKRSDWRLGFGWY